MGRLPSGDAGLFLRLGTFGFASLCLDLLGSFLRQEIAVGTANGRRNRVVIGRSQGLAPDQAAQGAEGELDPLIL